MKGCKLCEMYEHQQKLLSKGGSSPMSPNRLLNYCSHITAFPPIRSSSVGSSGSTCDTVSSSSSLSALSPTIPVPASPFGVGSNNNGIGTNLAESFGILQAPPILPSAAPSLSSVRGRGGGAAATVPVSAPLHPTVSTATVETAAAAAHFRNMFYATHLFNRGYYQPAGPLISPHVLPSIPPSNASLLSTKQIPSPLDSDPDQLQQPPQSTSAAESSDSEVLITGGDLTTFRYPSQQQQTQNQQLSVLSSQQQPQQPSPYSRSMHQMHYPPAYPPSYYSPYPGDAMCYSPPYQPYFPAKVYQSAPAYRRYPTYYQPGHPPPPTDLYEGPPPSSAAPPPPSGSQLVPTGPTAPQHMEHYPGPPGFYSGYSPGGGQCYSRGIQPPYMEYPPPCPCPMQSCPKNVLTGPLIGSNVNISGSNNSNNAAISTNSGITNSNNNNINNNSSNTTSSLNNQSQPLKAGKGPVQAQQQQQQHSMKTHNHILNSIEPTNPLTNGSILSKTHLHHHHMHQCKMEALDPLKSDLKAEIADRIITPTDKGKGNQYEEAVIPPTPPSSYTMNDKLIEPEMTVSPARGSTGLSTVPDPSDKAASTTTMFVNSSQPPMTGTISVRESNENVASTNPPSVIGRKARIGKSMAREMMYGAHAIHHQHQQQSQHLQHTQHQAHQQIYSNHTHIHHHLPSHAASDMVQVKSPPEMNDPLIIKSELSKIKKEEIKTEEEDVVLILDDDKQETKKIKTEPDIVEVFDDKVDSASKESASCESPVLEEVVEVPRHLNSKRMKILEINKTPCKKSPPNGYKSLIKQTEPKPYLCLSRKLEKKDRFMKISSKSGIRKRKLMLTEQQKKRLIVRKRKLIMLEKKKLCMNKMERSKSSAKDEVKSIQNIGKGVTERLNKASQKTNKSELALPQISLEHVNDSTARGYFSEPEVRVVSGRKTKKAKSNEARSKSETKKFLQAETTEAQITTSTNKNSKQAKHKPKSNQVPEKSSTTEEIFYDPQMKDTPTTNNKTSKRCGNNKIAKSPGKSSKGSKSCSDSADACNLDSFNRELNQVTADKQTSVNINNNIVEANNNKLLSDINETVDDTKSQEAEEEVPPLPEPAVEHIFNCPQPPKRNRSRTKFGNRKRQRSRHSVNQAVDTAVIPRKLNVVPRWNNGWSWEGDPFQGKVFLNSDDPLVIRTCYPAMRHEEGDVVQPRDCVLLRAGTKKNELPYVAKVAHLWENPEDGEMMMSLLWYYRPEHTEQGRQSNDCSDEVFASRHRDHNSVACIEDKCYVLTFSEYCRYRRSVRAAEEGIEEQISIVPQLHNYYSPREVPLNISPEQVLFCQRVYDFRLKRLVKTPNYN